jgi:hypothetical protein
VYIPEVLEGEARGRMRRLYHTIRTSLHAPLVHDLFRTLAFHPAFLHYALGVSRPNLLSVSFERLADQLRAIPPPEPAPQPLPTYVTQRDLRGAATLLPVFHYHGPKVLLLAAAWYEALSERPILGVLMEEAAFIPPGIPRCFPKSVPHLRIECASSHQRALLKGIADAHDAFSPAGEFRALAAYPTFLSGAWQQLHPYLHTPWYMAQRQRLLDQARMLAHQLPYPLALSVNRLRQILSEREIASCTGLVASYREQIASVVIDIDLICQMTDQPPPNVHYF